MFGGECWSYVTLIFVHVVAFEPSGCFQVFIFMSLGFDVCMSGFVCIEFMFKSIFILMPLCFDL